MLVKVQGVTGVPQPTGVALEQVRTARLLSLELQILAVAVVAVVAAVVAQEGTAVLVL